MYDPDNLENEFRRMREEDARRQESELFVRAVAWGVVLAVMITVIILSLAE